MAEEGEDYAKMGLKSGLEIHQQLDTGKLFCECPGYLRSDGPDFRVMRKLHAVAGESGEVDIAAEFEAAKGKEFVYEGYDKNTCLVELDEEPPHMINERALDETLKIALLMNCEIYPVAQIMRKTVINGSNTSGFQRTVLVGHNGYIETSFGKVGIETVALEEDSARAIEKSGKKMVFRLDRLGIPLVEIVTKPDMDSPEKVKEAALKIGEILRACKVKRGLGTIRQDLNISIKGHNRVEIKGFQDPKMMIKTVDLEIERQSEELKKKKKGGEVRGALGDGKTEFLRPMPGAFRMYPETDLPLLRISRDRINDNKKKLPKMRSEIRDELRKEGVGEELIGLVVENLDEFSALMKIYDMDANLVAKMITLWPSEFASKLKKSVDEIRERVSEAVLERVLESLRDGKIDDGDIKGILFRVASGEGVEEALKVEKIGADDLESEIERIVRERPGLSVNAYMGLVIKRLGTSVDKRKAMEILQRVCNKKG